MNSQIASYFVAFMIILAGIGLTGNIISNPSGSLKTLLLVLIVVGVFYLISRNFSGFSNKNSMKKERDAYRKAAKQSQKKYKQQNPRKVSFTFKMSKSGSVQNTKRTPKRRSSSHLRVIEGNKGKKKNRASF